MNIIGVCQTKDEQDLIEPWVRHHLALFDRVIIRDDSADRTREILSSMGKEFTGRILVKEQAAFGFEQAQTTTELLHQAASMGADFVFPLDADEFVGVRTRHSLQQSLCCLSTADAGEMAWKTFVVTPDTMEACTLDSPAGFRWRRATETPPYSKVVVRIHGQRRWDGFSLSMGNHGLESSHGPVATVCLPDVPLFHFPVRSQQQVIGKTVVRWISPLVHNPKARDSGGAWHAQRNFDTLVSGGAFDVCEMSLMYAQTSRPELVEEVPFMKYERRYSTGQSMNALALIARSWEKSLMEKVK